MANDDEVEPTPHGGTRIRTRSPTRRPLVEFTPVNDDIPFEEANAPDAQPQPTPEHALPPGSHLAHPAPPPQGPPQDPTQKRFKGQAKRLAATSQALLARVTDALSTLRQPTDATPKETTGQAPETFEILNVKPLPNPPPGTLLPPTQARTAPPPVPPTPTRQPPPPKPEPEPDPDLGPDPEPRPVIMRTLTPTPAPPPTPPRPIQEAPVHVTPKQPANDEGLFSRLRGRITKDEPDTPEPDDEPPEPQEEPASGQDDPDQDDEGLFSRLKNRFKRGETSPTEPPEPEPEPVDEALSTQDPERESATQTPASPQKTPLDALGTEGNPQPPAPPTKDDPIPTLPSRQDPEPTPPSPEAPTPDAATAHPSPPHEGDAPTPPTAHKPTPKPPEPKPKPKPETLHKKVDAILARYGEEPREDTTRRDA